MSDRQYNEKNEKDEKERTKQDEKTVEEKYRRDPLSAFLWGAILIWAGLIFLASNLGFLNFFQNTSGIPFGPFAIFTSAWSLILLGAGVIVLIGVAIRLVIPAYRGPVGGSIILGLILIGVGLGDLINWNIAWALILIGIGIWVLARALLKR